jgi:hypothetical protein
MTMDALEELYRARLARGWELSVYDYTANTWRDGEDAFRVSGTYERAVLTGPGARPIRVRVVPKGGSILQLDAGTAREMGVWRALGVRLLGRHVDLLGELLDDRPGQVSLEELAQLLRTSDDPLAAEILEAMAPILRSGGEDG